MEFIALKNLKKMHLYDILFNISCKIHLKNNLLHTNVKVYIILCKVK